jgi:hypothetical protein
MPISAPTSIAAGSAKLATVAPRKAYISIVTISSASS